MKYAVLSDIHANLDALESVLRDARKFGAETFVCLGDVVGYGPSPTETLARIRETCATVIAGNHDDAVSGRGDAAEFIELAGDAVRRHREALDARDLAWLKGLPYVAAIEGAVCTHGDCCDPARFYYIESERDAAANFAATDAQLVFAGHTHAPAVFLVGRSGTVYKTYAQDFTLEDGKRYIVNPGSVGYPREANGQCHSSYVLYDSAERTITYRFLPFSVASVMQRGPAPKRTRKTVFAAFAAAVALATGTAAFLLAPRVEVSEDPALLLDVRTLPVADDLRHVRANLELVRGSAPVLLRVTFVDEDGKPLTTEAHTVKKSLTREIKIPPGAREARFNALKVKPEDNPALLSFAPSASVK